MTQITYNLILSLENIFFVIEYKNFPAFSRCLKEDVMSQSTVDTQPVMDSRMIRDVMGHYPTGVAVVGLLWWALALVTSSC